MSRNIPQAMSWELDATAPLVEDPRVRPTARSNGGRIVGWPQADGGEVFVAANPSGVSLQFDLEPKVGVVLHHVSNSAGHVERSRSPHPERSFCCVVAKREPNIFWCQVRCGNGRSRTHHHGEVEVTGVELAAFRDSRRGQASGFPSRHAWLRRSRAPAQSERGLCA